MGVDELRSYLEYLAVRKRVSSSTQIQALNALIFLYDQVLQQPLGDIGEFNRPKRKRNIPVVMTRSEVNALLAQMRGVYGLMAGLMYGTGMRLMECIRLRVKDIDFERLHIPSFSGIGIRCTGLNYILGLDKNPGNSTFIRHLTIPFLTTYLKVSILSLAIAMEKDKKADSTYRKGD